jgi:hypothetical protein
MIITAEGSEDDMFRTKTWLMQKCCALRLCVSVQIGDRWASLREVDVTNDDRSMAPLQ